MLKYIQMEPDYSNIKNLLKGLTVEEKAQLLTGHDVWYTGENQKFKIPKIRMSDGPYGLRKVEKGEEAKPSVPATCFPPLCTVGNTFDERIVYDMGVALGEECLENGVNIILGPGVNIKRNPLCGRNFEYISEDPYLAGKLGINYVQGVQSKGVGTSLKHYCCNNEEDYRFISDSEVDERALREIYLKPFEMVIKEARPTTVMASYNKIRGVKAVANHNLLIDIARLEWNFNGTFISDWGAVIDGRDSLINGLDLEMPGEVKYHTDSIVNSQKSGNLDMGAVNRSCQHVIELAQKLKATEQIGFKYNRDEHHKIATRIAEEGAVLLKNEDKTLPLILTENFCVIGTLAEKMRFEGLGSSHVNPTRVSSPLEALRLYRKIDYAPGYRIDSDEPDPEMENAAINLANDFDKIVIFAGLTDLVESEGYDRKNLNLPANQLHLISGLLGLGKRVVIVLFNGSPVALPFIDNVDSILDMYLPGQGGGTACARLLFGDVNPSGHLMETWPMNLQDVPSYPYFNKRKDVQEYRESIFVGYRYYDKTGIVPLFPFGHGLTYTKFEYSDLNVKDNEIDFAVSFKIKNVGTKSGTEVTQLYISQRDTGVFKAPKSLKKFERITLEPSEEKEILFNVGKEEFAYYNIKLKEFVVESSVASILIGSSSADIRLRKDVKISGRNDIPAPFAPSDFPSYFSPINNIFPQQQFEILLGHKIPPEAPRLPLNMESTLEDFNQTRRGRKVYKLVNKFALKNLKKAEALDKNDPKRYEAIVSAKNLIVSLPNVSVSMIVGFLGSHFSYQRVQGLLMYVNKRPLSGIFKMLTGK